MKPYSIDLHGYNKSDAIQVLTAFLEEVRTKSTSTSMVLVITGSGKHSQQGAVLRSTIENLFQRREMQYTWGDSGKGSFLVDARSGFTLYEPEQPQDTKVIVSPIDSNGNKTLATRLRENLPQRPLSMLTKEELPTPSEVAATEEERRSQAQNALQEKIREEKCFRKAMSLSLLDIQKEEEEEDAMLKKAMSLSVIETSFTAREDEDIKKAIELSRAVACQAKEEQSVKEDEDLQRILELSKKEHEQNKEEEDASLQRAIELSKNDTNPEDAEVTWAIEQSKVHF